MSVINKMLNDLDVRKDSEEAKEEVAFLTPTVKRKKKWLMGLIFSVVFGILAIIVGYLHYSQLLDLKATLALINPPTEQNSNAEKDQLADPEKEPRVTKPPAEKATEAQPEKLELIVIPKKADNGQPTKPTQRASTLSVVTPKLTEKAPTQNDATLPATTPLQASVDGQQALPPLNTENKQQIITSADSPKPMGAVKADGSKMQIKRVMLTPEKRSKKVYEEAKNLQQSGLIKDSIEKYHQVLEIKPDHQKARAELAATYFGRAMVVESLTVLDEGLSMDPGNLGWSLLAAKIHYRRTNYAAALGYLQLPVEAFDAIEYVALKATTLQKMKDFKGAQTAYRQLTVAHPGNGRWWLGLGTSLEALRQNQAAIPAYRKSLRLSNISQASRQFVLSRLQVLEN